MKVFFNKKAVKITGVIIVTLIIMYAMVYIDVVLRARHSFLQGEKYWRWHSDPEEKQTELKKEFENEKTKLDKMLAKNKLKKDEYAKKLDIVEFNYNRKMEESSIKYAYIWYQTTIELFSPPESKWVKLSRKKMPRAKELWKEELRKKNIPFEDYMLE